MMVPSSVAELLVMLKNILHYIRDTIIDFFYPPHCPVCNKYIEDRDVILCSQCSENIMAVERYPYDRPPIKEIWRLTKYKGGTREIIRDLKFSNKLDRIKVTNKILDKALQSDDDLQQFMKKIEIATFVPLHAKREKERGFNQVELIFKDWLAHQNIFIERLIIRTRETEHLYDKNLKERQQELVNAFALAEGSENIIKGKRILILDDIFTTGTTMSECAKVLKSNGANEVYGLALASDFKD